MHLKALYRSFLLALVLLVLLMSAAVAQDDADVCTPVGPEIRVSTATTGFQDRPAIAADAKGNGYMSVWRSNKDGSYRIYGQIFTSNGTKVGPEIRVSTATTGFQDRPAIAANAQGDGYMSVWQSDQDGGGYIIYGQIFTSNGTKVDPEIRVSTNTTGFQDRPAIAANAQGDGYMSVWRSKQDGTYRIYGQIFTSNGTKEGPEIRVSTTNARMHWYPAIAANAKGNGYMSVWQSTQDGGNWRIYGQVFTSNGTKVGPEIRVSTNTTRDQTYPAIAAEAKGNGYMSVWQSTQDGGNWRIYGQIFTSNGTKVGPEIRVSTATTGDQQYPAIAANAKGNGYMSVWMSTQDGNSRIHGQIFTSNGTKVGPEIRVSTANAGSQYYPVIAANAKGNGYMSVWQSNQDGSNRIYGRVFYCNIASTTKTKSLSASKSLGKSSSATQLIGTFSPTATASTGSESTSSSFSWRQAASNFSATKSLVPLVPEKPKDAQATIQGRVLSDLAGEDGGKAIAGVGYSGGAFGGVFGTPTVAAVGSRVASSLYGVLCAFLDSVMEPTWWDGVVVKLGDGEYAHVSGTTLSTSIVLYCCALANFVMGLVNRRYHLPWTKTASKIFSVVTSMPLSAYTSSLSYMSTLLLTQMTTNVTDLCIGIVGHTTLIAMMLTLTCILIFRFGAQLAAAPAAGTPQFTAGRPLMKYDFEDAPHCEGFTAALGPFFDGCRDPDLLSHRLYFVFDLVFSWLIGLITGLLPWIRNCYVTGCLIIALCLVHLLYLVIVRPHSRKIDTVMSFLFTFIQLLCVLMGLLSNEFSICEQILSCLLVGLSFSMLIQAALAVLWFWFLLQRRKFRQSLALQSSSGGTSGALSVPMLNTGPQGTSAGGNVQSAQAPPSSSSSGPNASAQQQQQQQSNPLSNLIRTTARP